MTLDSYVCLGYHYLVEYESLLLFPLAGRPGMDIRPSEETYKVKHFNI